MNNKQRENALASNLKDWLANSSSPFDVVVGEAASFPVHTVFVDPAFLDREFERAFPNRLGALRLEILDKSLRKIALTYSQRLAQAEADRLEISKSGLKKAWFHPLYSEVTTLVPLRHLARKLYKAHRGDVFAIRLESTNFEAINSWNINELESIYLAFELRRLGANVCLRTDELNSQSLHFGLSGTWMRKWRSQFRRNREFSTVLCRRHMRRSNFVSRQSGASHRVRPGLLPLLKSRGIVGNRLSVALREGPTIDGCRVYSVPDDVPTLLQAFSQLMVPVTQFIRDRVREKFEGRNISAAHIADHTSLEGGLLAAEVVEQGGNLNLWPHSANVVDLEVHEPEEVARITLAARSTADVWARKFGTEKVSVDVRTLLQELHKVSPFDEARPIHVVLFAGAHALQRAPFFDLEDHRNSWRSVLSEFQTSGVHLTIKHKSQWETRDWISQNSNDASRLHFTRTHATKLKLPNMVFMSISLTSTAIFEGIARGIPCFVVRDFSVNETPYYDPKFVPRVLSNAVTDFLMGLNNREAWEELRNRQQEWFAKETS